MLAGNPPRPVACLPLAKVRLRPLLVGYGTNHSLFDLVATAVLNSAKCLPPPPCRMRCHNKQHEVAPSAPAKRAPYIWATMAHTTPDRFVGKKAPPSARLPRRVCRPSLRAPSGERWCHMLRSVNAALRDFFLAENPLSSRFVFCPRAGLGPASTS